jgi:hypothetical protein
MMAAISAAQAGAEVTLYERQSCLGRKLSASGGGRCNLTNSLDPEEFMRRFGPRGRFMAQALRSLPRDALLRALRQWGVDTKTEDGFHYFPASQRATDVRDALRDQMTRLQVRVRLNTCATRLIAAEGRVAGVEVNGACETANAVIVAGGGAAWPALGGCSLGYDLARQAGHSIVEPSAALVGLITRDTWSRACAGVALPDVTAWIDLPRTRKRVWRGVLLFTHRGVSGPVILDLSGQVVETLRDRPVVPLRLCLQAGTSRADWEGHLADWRRSRGTRTVRNLLDEKLPQSLATTLWETCGIPADLRASRMEAGQQAALLEHLTAMPLSVVSSEGMESAMVTRGGVALNEVDPMRLESRILRGLHWAGEVLDLDGPCGGYNLQWAFSSGWLAGLSVAQPD